MEILKTWLSYKLSLTLLALLGFAAIGDVLRCNCTSCEKTGYECETNGACLTSTYYNQEKEHHLRLCINQENLVPPGKPVHCLSAEGYFNSRDVKLCHCCHHDYCNYADLKAAVPAKVGDGPNPGHTLGPVELVAVIAGPVFLLCVCC